MPMPGQLDHLYCFMKLHHSHSTPGQTMTATGSDFGICRLRWAFPSIILCCASLLQSSIAEATLVKKCTRPCLPLTGPQLPMDTDDRCADPFVWGSVLGLFQIFAVLFQNLLHFSSFSLGSVHRGGTHGTLCVWRSHDIFRTC